MEENPWKVDSIQAFYLIKCPECTFDTKQETLFQEHAFENHPLSHVLFHKKLENNATISEPGETIDISEKSLKPEEKFDSPIYNCDLKNKTEPNGIEGNENTFRFNQQPNEKKKKPPYKCANCKLRFETKTSLWTHNTECEVHDGQKPFNCSICNTNYSKKADLVNHNKTVHGSKKPHQCNLCDLSFSQKFTLKLHKKKKHTYQKRKYKCSACDKTFIQKEALKKHKVRTHNGKQPLKSSIKCQKCDVSFSKQRDLERHIESVHIGIKLCCPLCNADFTNNNDLIKHNVLVHEGLKPQGQRNGFLPGQSSRK